MKMSVEEQVAELTQAQQDKVLRTGKIAAIVCVLIMIPWILGDVFGVFLLLNPPLGFDYSNFGTLCIGVFVWMIGGFLAMMSPLVIAKLACPYYSDAKWKYINKQRKGK